MSDADIAMQEVHTLYSNHHGWLQDWLRRRLGSPMDAEDLAQDTFLRVIRSPQDVGSLREPRHFLVTIAKGLTVDLFRRRSLERQYLEALASLPEPCWPSEEERALTLEVLMELDVMLAGLGAKVREAFFLSQFEGLTYPQIQEQQEDPALQEEPASTASAPPDATQDDDVEAAAPNQGVFAPVVDQNRLMDWQSNLMLRLNDVKRYPADARRLRQEGIAYLRFTMDRKGVVLAASIERSSGRPLLDEETLALIERAQPLPQPPKDMPGETLEFVVPVEFFLNR